MFLQTSLPRVLLSDRGSAFTSEPFQNFLTACNVRHRASTPQYAQSNGAAERAVQTLKHLRAKCSSASQLFQAVLQLQNTPRGLAQATPSGLFLGRSQRTTADLVPRQFSRPWLTQVDRLKRQQTLSAPSTRLVRPTTFLPGSTALLRDFFGSPAPVVVIGYGDAPRSYKIRLPSGTITEQNSSFLFPLPWMKTSAPCTPTSPLMKKTPKTSNLAAGSSEHPVAIPSSFLRTCASRPAHPLSSHNHPTAVLAPLPSPTASFHRTAPVSWQVDPGLPFDSWLLTGRSARTPTPGSSPSSQPASNVTSRAGIDGCAAKRLVPPTANMLTAAAQGFRPAQLLVRRHRPPPTRLVARPPNWNLAKTTPLPPSPLTNSPSTFLSPSQESPVLRQPSPPRAVPRTPPSPTGTP